MSAVDRLADAYGIESAFRDARGEVRRTSRETKVALLRALGLAVEDEASAERLLAERERGAWAKALRPATVAYADALPLGVDLVLPAGSGSVAWRIALEDGGERRGRVPFVALAVLGRRTENGRVLERRRLTFGSELPPGYHRLRVEPDGSESALIVTPGRCFVPEPLAAGALVWGLSLQLYLLRSAANWGIGDYSDLRRLVEILAAQHGEVVGLNPLHAMFLDDPEHASPYSPQSRLLLNVLNIDVTAVPGFEACRQARRIVGAPSFAERLTACRSAQLVPYAEVAELKLPVLRALFDFHRGGGRRRAWAAFERFCEERGDVLRESSIFAVLRDRYADDGSADWRRWPAELHDPRGAAVATFAAEHADDVLFQSWLQWVADLQLGEACRAAAGMRVGLYRDLAVGANAAGAETWSNPTAVMTGVRVGAPPDIYNPNGQDWGLPAFHPDRLRDEAYRSFVQLVRANMRHAGAIRIDHAMALLHLYLIPEGASPADGAYVRYPLDDLVGVLALESARARCVVIGEDLGTVPEGFRERMARADVLSYRVLFFEREPQGDAFLPPERYPALALAVASSHDLPTLRAWWTGEDLRLQARLGILDDERLAQRRAEREGERAALLGALRAEALLPPGGEPAPAALLAAVHGFLARTPSMLALAQLDDVAEETTPVNVPATTDEHPNWRRRLSLSLEELADDPRFSAVAATFNAQRYAR